MLGILDFGIIGSGIFALYNVLKDKSRNRDSMIKFGLLLLFFFIILKLLI